MFAVAAVVYQRLSVAVTAKWSLQTRGFISEVLAQGKQAIEGMGGVEGGKPGPWVLAVGRHSTSFSLELEAGGPGSEKVARLGWLLHDLSSCQHVSLAGLWAEGDL